MDKYKKQVKVLHENYNSVLQWLVAIQHGNKMDRFLSKSGYKKVAVYGMNDIGNCIVRELINSEHIVLLYAIDQGEPKLYLDIACYRLDELSGKEKPDVIIVALPSIYEDIREGIETVTGCITKSITEIVYEMDY